MPQASLTRSRAPEIIRILESAVMLESPAVGTLDEAYAWLAQRQQANTFSVEPIDFAEMRRWSFGPDTGDLVHDSGGFFQIRGVRAVRDEPDGEAWSQPIIDQPEVGILGILTKEIDGVLCLLMQAKMEPGNVNTIQLSPTVQATRSNYLRRHGGAATRYLEYFQDEDRGRVLADVLQSEHGTRFYRKRNRNIIVEIDDTPHLTEDYRWMTLGQVYAMFSDNNLVNMDTRSVLSCLPLSGPARDNPADPFAAATLRSLQACRDLADVQRWLNHCKAGATLNASLIPLGAAQGWYRGPREIVHESGRHFKVIAAAIRASSREVSSWTQPLIAPCGQGVIAFLASRASGVLEVLVHARQEIGLRDGIELGPTVQCNPVSGKPRPYLDVIEAAALGDFHYDVVQSEEGGRFYHGENRYAIVEVDDDFRRDKPRPGYRWVTLGQLAELLPHSGYLSVEARSLIACAQASLRLGVGRPA
jgi:dTDP-4-dehydro-6-deoxy-alpha-D-glucopyranose 2,3-dehydratase